MEAAKMGKQQLKAQSSKLKSAKLAARSVCGKYHENQRVVLVCLAESGELPYERRLDPTMPNYKQAYKARLAERERLGLYATADPADRAHGVDGIVDSGHGGKTHGLVSAEDLGDGQAKPRKYPASQLCGRGRRVVAIDSVYDDTYERQLALAGIPGVGVRTGDWGYGGSGVVDVRSQALVQRNALVRIAESQGTKRKIFDGVFRK